MFHNFSHIFIVFPPGLSPSKLRVLAQGEQKRRKDSRKNRTNRCCTLVVARLSSSYDCQGGYVWVGTSAKRNCPKNVEVQTICRPGHSSNPTTRAKMFNARTFSPVQLSSSFSPALFKAFHLRFQAQFQKSCHLRVTLPAKGIEEHGFKHQTPLSFLSLFFWGESWQGIATKKNKDFLSAEPLNPWKR